ncbi:MAG: hypothetical protein ACRD68_17960, partial [Pyrinomonadaceae bacterium]
EERTRGVLRRPQFLERNFGIREGEDHAVWVESKGRLHTDIKYLETEQPRPELHAVRGSLRDEDLAGPGALVIAERAGDVTEAWTDEPVRGDGEVVRQIIREREVAGPSSVVLVVDTSRRMREHIPETVAVVRQLPPDIELSLILADGNGLPEEGISRRYLTGRPGEIAGRLEGSVFEGGADNVPALLKAWDVASENPGGVIVWIHGPQPLLLSTVEELRQRWERRPDGPTLYAVQVGNGPDRVGEKLDGLSSVESVPRFGGLQADLETFFARLIGQRRPLEFVRTNEKQTQTPATERGKETSAHLARLWANDEVSRLITRERDGNEKAILLAAHYQLVTPVSGAVVLETQEQYRRAGLE